MLEFTPMRTPGQPDVATLHFDKAHLGAAPTPPVRTIISSVTSTLTGTGGEFKVNSGIWELFAELLSNSTDAIRQTSTPLKCIRWTTGSAVHLAALEQGLEPVPADDCNSELLGLGDLGGSRRLPHH